MANAAKFLQRLPLAPVIALMFAMAAAALVAATPQWLFENAVVSTGISNVLVAAHPPLHTTARLIAVLAAFAVVGGVVWCSVVLVEALLSRRTAPADDELDLAQFADELPKLGGRRRPISADRELGAPLMSDEALVVAAPLVLEAPEPESEPELVAKESATVEPDAAEAGMPEVEPEVVPEVIPAEVIEPLAIESIADPDRPPAPEREEDAPLLLDAPLDVAEFDLGTAEEPSEESAARPDESSIDALIRRLEAGLARRGLPTPPGPAATNAQPAQPKPRDWMVREDDVPGEPDESATRAMVTLKSFASR